MPFKSVFGRNPFSSLPNTIDLKIERVLTGFLIGWTKGRIRSSICSANQKWKQVSSSHCIIVFFLSDTPSPCVSLCGVRVIVNVFNANFNNMSYRGGQFYWWGKPVYTEKTTDLSQVTNTLYHIIVSSTHRHERDSNQQIMW